MSDKTGIEWCHTMNPDGTVTPGATWNPLRAKNLETGQTGWHCEVVSAGCCISKDSITCYSNQINKGFFQLGTGLPFLRESRDKVEIFIDKKILDQPLRWRRPRKIFVCSMTDLFGDFHTDEMIDEGFALMGACDDADRDHTFIVLTKRHKRMLEYMKTRARKAWNSRRMNRSAFPPRNIWLGVSCENQKAADERIPALLEAPAAVRFISAEPLLGHIHLWNQWIGKPSEDVCLGPSYAPTKLDWVIVGGESGGHARPMHPRWAKELRDQCAAAGVAFFFKQWGGWKPVCEMDEAESDSMSYPRKKSHTDDSARANKYPTTVILPDGSTGEKYLQGAMLTFNIGKKKAGRKLDGKEHTEFPTVS